MARLIPAMTPPIRLDTRKAVRMSVRSRRRRSRGSTPKAPSWPCAFDPLRPPSARACEHEKNGIGEPNDQIDRQKQVTPERAISISSAVPSMDEKSETTAIIQTEYHVTNG